MIKHILLSILAIFFTSIGISQDLSTSNLSDEKSKNIAIQKYDSLFSALYREKGFNGNVLIAQNGEVIYKNVFGYSDLKTKEPLNFESTFQIASVTKQFTAMAIMMLYEQGKLAFTDSVHKFFPNFPYKGITIHQLLSHRSGLPEYMRFARKYWKNKNQLMKNSDVINMLIAHKPKLLFTPDKKFNYGNTGYVVLACIIEKASKISYHKYLKERIFNRLKMTNTFVYLSKTTEDVDITTKGHNKNESEAEEDYLSGVVGDKGIYSTVEDMLKWDQALYTEQLVKQATLQKAFMPISYDEKRNNNYGYGWRINTTEDGKKIVYHAGWWRGYNSLFVRKLNDRTSLIILCNRVNDSFDEIDSLINLINSPKIFLEESYSN